MVKTVKESVHRMTSHLQQINSYLAMKDCTKALGKTRDTKKELHALATSLSCNRSVFLSCTFVKMYSTRESRYLSS